VRTTSRGAAGVVSVLSTMTRTSRAFISTTSVKVPPMSTASRQSDVVGAAAIAEVLSRRGEDVEDPHLVHLVVADEDAVAVPDGSGGQGHAARAGVHARLAVPLT